MTKNGIEIIVQLLQTASIKGADVPAYNAVIRELEEEMEKLLAPPVVEEDED